MTYSTPRRLFNRRSARSRPRGERHDSAADLADGLGVRCHEPVPLQAW